MKKNLVKPVLFTALIISAFQFPGCKNKAKETSTVTDTVMTDTAIKTAPVVIAADDELTSNTKDAIKDFPDVTAVVKDGEINLTGSIVREKLQQLLMNLNALHPKKINNNLTITK